MSFSIMGKTAIVTGAANGIGLAIARHFADQGANVMCVDMDETRLTAEFGRDGEGENLRYFVGDLRQRLTTTNLVSATIDAFDRIDILVNAARQVVETDALNPDDETVGMLFEQNVATTLRLIQQVARRMIKQTTDHEDTPPGTIVNLGSIASGHVRPELLGHAISAAALDQMTRGMALVLAPHRIRVNAVAFGAVMSASLKNLLQDHPDWRGEIEARTPMQRIASPSELVHAVQFLASDGAGFMTGEIVTIDGGLSLLDPVAAPAR